MNGSVVVGCTVNARCVAAGLSAKTVASHVPGPVVASKNQVHCGSAVPALVNTSDSASPFIAGSSPSFTLVKPSGAPRPATRFVIVTPNASAPASTEIAPGSAIVVVEPEPDAEWCTPSAVAVTELTPLPAGI